MRVIENNKCSDIDNLKIYSSDISEDSLSTKC